MRQPSRPLTLPHGLTALRERNFALYAVGQFISQSGNWVEVTAVNWILYDLTQSPTLLGLGGLFRAFPVILLALFGGAVADRLPRRRLLLFTESTLLVLALGIGTLAAQGRLEFWHLYILNLVNGTLASFSVPARQALFPGLVPRAMISSAVTLNAVAVRAAVLVGPAVAGIALAVSGYAAPFYLNAVSFIAILVALLAMRLPADAAAIAAPQTIRRGVFEGIGFVRTDPALRTLLGLEVLASLLGQNPALVTLLARDVLNTGPEGLGTLMGSLGAGALLGLVSLIVAPVDRLGRLVVVVGAGYAVLLAAAGLSPWFVLTTVCMLGLGAADAVWTVTRNSVAQLMVPDSLRGRVMSVVILTSRGLSPVGQALTGFLAGTIGVVGTTLIGAVVIGSGVGISARTLDSLRSLARDPEPFPLPRDASGTEPASALVATPNDGSTGRR